MTGPPVLSVRGLAVAFGSIQVVHGLDCDVAADETVCLVGESGSGKSITAAALCGLLPEGARLAGSVLLDGTPVTGADPATLRRLRGQAIGFVFQDPATTLNPVLPVGRQVTEAPMVHGTLRRSAAPAWAVELLREVEIADPAGRARQYPHQFSGGMRQRAGIAMAMAGHPRLIIADEPTTALDVTIQAQVLDMLARRRRQTGAAMLLITHDLGVVAEVADRVLVMYAGRIIESAAAADLFAAPRHPYTRALLRSVPRLDGAASRLDPIPGQPPSPAAPPPGCNFHPRCALADARCRTELPVLRPAGPGLAACHHLDRAEPAARAIARSAAPPPGPVLLRVERLHVAYAARGGMFRRARNVRAVDGIDLELRAGETLGLVGESGCGKSSASRAIMGLVSATAGRVLLEGADLSHLPPSALRRARRHMQYLFQDPFSSLNPMLTAGDAIAEPMRIHRVFETMGGARRVAELIERVGLPPDAVRRPPHAFSGGQKQRIAIARALAMQPKLLILDEPVASLDVSIQAQIVNLLQDLQAELGLAYLFIAHDLAVVRHISRRVAVMYLGRIVEHGEAAALYSAPRHPYTETLLSAVPRPGASRCRGRVVRPGEVPDPAAPPPGCTFHPRCPRASAICRTEAPEMLDGVACHHPGVDGRLAA